MHDEVIPLLKVHANFQGASDQSLEEVVLDYNTGPEPRVLWLWRDLGDELRDEGDVTFDRMIVRQREVSVPPR